MSADNEKVQDGVRPEGIDQLRAVNLRAIASSRQVLHLIKAYMQEKDEQRKQWILMDILAKSEAKRN